MEIFLYGTSHRVAPATVRERCHLPPDEAFETLGKLLRGRRLLVEAVPVATCARLELYAVTDDAARARRTLDRLLTGQAKMTLAELRRHTYVLRGPYAVRHLLRVASGLDSVIPGEAEILGQVREAAHHPCGARLRGPYLHRLFETAIATGKRVRAETGLGRGAASVASAAVEMIRRQMGSLVGARALVLGAGQTGSLVARLLHKAGARQLLVANRSMKPARALAEELGAEACSLDRLEELLGEYDLVVGAVATDAPLVTPERLIRVLERRVDSPAPLRLVDLAHPPNFSSDVAELNGVVLTDLETVFARVAEAHLAREAHRPVAEEIVGEATAHYMRWLRSRPGVAVLTMMREQVLSLARAEAERVGRGSSEEERARIQVVARSVARRLLHAPTMALREADPSTLEGRWLLDCAQALFALSGHDGRRPASVRPGLQSR